MPKHNKQQVFLIFSGKQSYLPVLGQLSIFVLDADLLSIYHKMPLISCSWRFLLIFPYVNMHSVTCLVVHSK